MVAENGRAADCFEGEVARLFSQGRRCCPLKHDSQTPARHDRRVGYGEVGTDDLQIARQLKLRCDVEVVEDLKLVLGAQPQATKDKQVDIVLDHLAQVRERVSDAELIVHSSGKETVAAQPNVEESRDWAGRG